MKRLCLLLLTAILLFSGCTQASKPEDGRIVVALIDTGIAAAAISGDRILAGYNYVTPSSDTQDRINHGTALASIFAGSESAGVPAQADFAYLVPLVVSDKIAGTQEQIGADALAQVIRDAVDVYRADIINLSIGVKSHSQALQDAVAYAEDQGVLLVAAVGNGGSSGSAYFPAAYPTVLAVGSCNKSGKASSFSQNGSDVLAQGEGLLLASRNGLPYGVKGTSFAAGTVSALAANFLQADPDLSCEQLRQKILDAAAANGGFLLLQ